MWGLNKSSRPEFLSGVKFSYRNGSEANTGPRVAKIGVGVAYLERNTFPPCFAATIPLYPRSALCLKQAAHFQVIHLLPKDHHDCHR